MRLLVEGSGHFVETTAFDYHVAFVLRLLTIRTTATIKLLVLLTLLVFIHIDCIIIFLGLLQSDSFEIRINILYLANGFCDSFESEYPSDEETYIELSSSPLTALLVLFVFLYFETIAAETAETLHPPVYVGADVVEKVNAGLYGLAILVLEQTISQGKLEASLGIGTHEKKYADHDSNETSGIGNDVV